MYGSLKSQKIGQLEALVEEQDQSLMAVREVGLGWVGVGWRWHGRVRVRWSGVGLGWTKEEQDQSLMAVREVGPSLIGEG